MLKIQSRLYNTTLNSSVALRNGLVSLLDQSFPGANRFFLVEGPNSFDHVKWVDLVGRFWHKDCAAAVSLYTFADSYKNGAKGADIGSAAQMQKGFTAPPETRFQHFRRLIVQNC